MFYEDRRMTPDQIGELSARTTALTHGSKDAILSGVVLSYAIAGILQDPDVKLQDQFAQAVSVMQAQFPCEEADRIFQHLQQIFEMAKDTELPIRQGMEQLHCETAEECLAGAMYAALACNNDVDAAMIGAVNHSGFSAATGAVTGAILGARMGAEALPDFYVESIEPQQALAVLAEDLLCSTPATGLFDDDWDQKYVQGEPL